MERKKFKSSPVTRLAKISKSLLVAGGHIAAGKIKNKIDFIQEKKEEFTDTAHKIKAAKEIIQQMGNLKGALMKLGQMISITEDLIISPEISALFRELQKKSPPMRDKDLDTVFRESFSKKPEEIFKSFNRIPMASASIGQVHEATLQDGTKVAVKVQYPKIVKAIKSDFKNIDQIKKLLLLIFPNLPNVDNYLHELKDNLFLECDYNYEADNINWFRDHLMPLVEGIYIPQVFSDYSSSTILTMEFVEGDSYEETKHYSQESRNYLGQVLYNFHMTTLYQLNKMHTDPQNGNYLFQPDKIILLDFGSIKKFPPDFIDLYIKLIQSIENKDLDSYKELIKAVGFLTEQDDEPHIEKHFELVSQLYLPYTKEGVFCIDPQNPFQMIDTFAKSISLKGRSTPRQEFLLLDRANLGLYTKLKYWRSEIDWVSKKEEVWENFYK